MSSAKMIPALYLKDLHSILENIRLVDHETECLTISAESEINITDGEIVYPVKYFGDIWAVDTEGIYIKEQS